MEDRNGPDLGPANAPRQPTARERFTQRAAERERDWLERQRSAHESADRLIRGARTSRKNCHAALAEVARRVASLLAVARCDILLLDGTTRAVRYQMNTNLSVPSSRVAVGRAEPDIAPPTVSVQALAFAQGRSPLELLRSDGPINRIYAFMNGANNAGPIGILCVQSHADYGPATQNRQVLDAVAYCLGTALANGAFRGWRAAGPDPRRIP